MNARVRLLLVGLSLAPTLSCGLVWSFSGYAGSPLGDAGPDAMPDRSSREDVAMTKHREGGVDATPDRGAPPGKDAHVTDHELAREAQASDAAKEAAAPCDGPCVPVTLDSTSTEVPSSIALDTTNVYWTALYGTTVRVVGKDGSSPSSLGTMKANYFTSMAIGGATAYFGSTLGYVASCPTGGCPVAGYSPLFGVDGGDIEGVATFGSRLFAIAEHVDGSPALLLGDVDGGTPTVIHSMSGYRLTGVATNDGGLFWSTVQDIDTCTPSSSRNPAPVASDNAGITALTVDAAGDVFWLDLAGSLEACDQADVATGGCGSPKSLARNLTNPAELAADDTYVYVSTSGPSDGGATGNGTILRCAQSGCLAGPTVLASNELAPGPIAVDSTAVYWADTAPDGNGDYLIRKVLKP